MRVAVYLPFVISALFGLAGPWLGRRLPPATATRMLALAGLVCAASTTFALAVLAWTYLGENPLIASIGGWSARAVQVRDPVPAVAAEVAGLVLAVLGAVAVRAACRHVTAVIGAARACRGLPGDAGGLVVLDDPVPDAYALPGTPYLGTGRIVVSTGMLRALPADERRVLLAHERGHLRYHHHLYRAAAAIAAAANPLVASLSRAVRHSTERWADEYAAASVGDRTLAARALARATLATDSSAPHRHPAALGFGRDEATARARALLGAPPRRRPLVTTVLIAALAVCLAATNEARADTEGLFEQAMRQPHTAADRAPDRHAACQRVLRALTRVARARWDSTNR